MHPLSLLLIVMAAVAHSHPAAATTPAAQFWEEVLPDTPMPQAIADLVQKGIDHSPLAKHYPVPFEIVGHRDYGCLGGCPSEAALLPGFFFIEAQMRVGSIMKVSFPPSAVPPILPRDVAEEVPFSNLADVLATFSIAPGSDEAMKVGNTLRGCQAPPLAGEQKTCTISLEATIQSAMSMLGSTTGQVWVATSELTRAGLPHEPYVVHAVTLLAGDHHVACHSEPYPYAVYQYHMTGMPTKVYMVALRSLRGGGAPVAMAAMCHLDTSKWNPGHPAFKMLQTQPGGEPLCHFVPYADLVFGKMVDNT